VGEIDEVGAFLKQIPPDWDRAMAHGAANRVVNPDKTVLDISNKDSYCVCCMLPVPDDEAKFSLCTDLEELAALGPGFPLFFGFIKYLTILLLILSLIFTLPSFVLIY
jgi:hypothetical protein